MDRGTHLSLQSRGLGSHHDGVSVWGQGSFPTPIPLIPPQGIATGEKDRSVPRRTVDKGGSRATSLKGTCSLLGEPACGRGRTRLARDRVWLVAGSRGVGQVRPCPSSAFLTARDAADLVVQGRGKFEELMVCSHEIAASTAQLVAASKVGPVLGSAGH